MESKKIRHQYRNKPYPRQQPYPTQYNVNNTYQSSSYINSRSSGGSTSYHYHHQQHSNRSRETELPLIVPKIQRLLPSKEIPQPPPKINEEDVQKNVIRYVNFEQNIKERLDSFKEKKKDGLIICHREMKEIKKGFSIPFDEWSSFVAAAPKIPPRPKDKHPQPHNNRFSPYNKTSSSLQQKSFSQKQSNTSSISSSSVVNNNNGSAINNKHSSVINDNNNIIQESKPALNPIFDFLYQIGLGNSNILNENEMKIVTEKARKKDAIKRAKESLKSFREERKGKMSPEIEVIAHRSKKAPEIAAKRPAQMAPITKSPDKITRDSSKMKLDSNLKLIVKLSYNKTDRQAWENHVKGMKRHQNLSSSSSSSSSSNPTNSSAASSTSDLISSSSLTSISTAPTMSTKKIINRSTETAQCLGMKDNEILAQPPSSKSTQTDYKYESKSVQTGEVDPEEVLFNQTVAEGKFKLAKSYKRRADHSRSEKELSIMTEKQKLERLSDHMEILILYIEWFYRNIQAHGENTIDKIGTVLNGIDNHFVWVSDNARKHDPLALLPLINKLRAIFLMNRLELEQKRFTKLSNEYIKSYNEEAKNGICSNTISNKYINTLNEMQKSATNLFKLINNLWDESKNFHVSDRVNNGVNPLNLTMPIEKASEFSRMFVSDWRNINKIVFVSLSREVH